jgi:hypothetical protein
MRRDLAVAMRHHEIFAKNAAEILERVNCTPRLIMAIVDRTAEYLEVFAACKAPLDEWARNPLAEIGLDMPLGKIPNTGEPNRG